MLFQLQVGYHSHSFVTNVLLTQGSISSIAQATLRSFRAHIQYNPRNYLVKHFYERKFLTPLCKEIFGISLPLDNRNPMTSEKLAEFNRLMLLGKLTDAGDVSRLLDRYGDQLRYVNVHERWSRYDGRQWVHHSDIWDFVLALQQHMYQLTQDLLQVPDADHKLLRQAEKRAIAGESNGSMQAVSNAASKINQARVSPEAFDQHHMLLNVENGIIDLETGKLRRHDPKLLCSMMAGTYYDTKKEAPEFQKFLLSTFMGDQDTIDYVLRSLGYALTGLVTEQKGFFHYGPGGNDGKGVLIRTILKLMKEYGVSLNPAILIINKSDPHSTILASLFHKRFGAIPEMKLGTMDQTQFKLTTGGDSINGRKLYEDENPFMPTHKLFVSTNRHLPVVTMEPAIKRRLQVTPFELNLAVGQEDKQLESKLQAELPGILNILVAKCLEWQRIGLQPSSAVLAATQKYIDAEDLVQQFVDSDYVLIDPKGYARTSHAHQAYVHFCKQMGEPKPMHRSDFQSNLEQKGFEYHPKHNGNPKFKGFVMRSIVDDRGNLVETVDGKQARLQEEKAARDARCKLVRD